MAKVLFLSPEVPFPLHGGSHIRQHFLLKNVSNRHQVDLLCLARDDKEMAGVEKMRTFCHRVEAVDFRAPTGMGAKISGLLGASPAYMTFYSDPRLVLLMEDFLNSQQYDIIQYEYSFMASYREYAKNQPGAKNILTVQDFMSFKYARDAEKATSIARRLYARRESRRWRLTERRIFPTFDALLTPSENNRALLNEQYPEIPVKVIENGADTEGIEPQLDDDSRTICFIGSLHYLPNIEAVQLLLNDILPLVIKHKPDVKLVLVGSRPPAWIVERGARDPNVEVTGYVDSVYPYLYKSTMLIVPLLTGGGTRLKILEAFAAGKSVVSTRIGAEGIDCESGKNILLADDPQDIAQAVIDLLNDKERRLQLGAAARKLVEERYSWPALGKKLGDFWDELCK